MLITIAAVGTIYLWSEGGALNYILGLLPFIGSLGLVFFELLICSLQAYVFVLLTAIYLESSLADSH
jgi:F-type H+-transporting ATPase subunit a